MFRISSISCEILLPAFCPRLLLREIYASLSASLYPPAGRSFPQLAPVFGAVREVYGGQGRRGVWGSGFTENSILLLLRAKTTTKAPPQKSRRYRRQTKSFMRLINFVNSVQLRNWELREKYQYILSQRQVQNLKREHKLFKKVISLHRTEIRFSLRLRGRRCVRHAAPWTGS